jgi:hypothetical protein
MTTCYTSVGSTKKQNGQKPEERHNGFGRNVSWFILVVRPTFACLKLRKPRKHVRKARQGEGTQKAYTQNTNRDWHPLHLHDWFNDKLFITQ